MRPIDADKLKTDAEARIFLVSDTVGKLIDEQPTVEPVKRGEWIDVNERLPAEGEHVLCYYNYEEHSYIGWRHGEKWETDLFDDALVDYWMPLPEPPKEER